MGARDTTGEDPSRLDRGLLGAGDVDADQIASALARAEQFLLGPQDEALTSERFMITRELGSGGFGRVFLAYDAELDRKVALKQVHRRDLGGDGEALLIREARLLAQLRHPNIVSIYDIQEVLSARGRPTLCIIMEYVEGSTLRDWWMEAERSPAEILRVMIEAGRGLAAAHAGGIIHRDFKPTNVIIDAAGCARVLDFGLSVRPARRRSPGDGAAVPGLGENSVDSDADTHVRVTGTPLYMAPERFRDPKGSVRSDVFSFGVTLWEALCGARPFAGDSLASLRAEICAGAIIEPKPGFAPTRRIDRLLRRALAVDPEDRFESMDALLAELTRDPWRHLRRAGITLAVVIAVLSATLLGYLMTRPGTVEIDVEAADGRPLMSEVWIGERRLEVGPDGARVEVGAGIYRLRVQAPSMLAEEGVVEVARGSVLHRTIRMQPTTGALNVELSPVGASVLLDGVEYGSRLHRHRLTTGLHQLHARLVDHYETRRDLAIDEDEVVDHYISLAPAVLWARQHTGVRFAPSWVGDVNGDGRQEVAHRFFNVVTVSDPWSDRDLWTLTTHASSLSRASWIDVGDGGPSQLVTVEHTDEADRVSLWRHPPAGVDRPTLVWRRDLPILTTGQEPRPMDPSLASVPGGRALIVANVLRGESVALDIADGETRWRVEGEQVRDQLIAKRAGGAEFIVQLEGGRLRALDADTGAELWASDGEMSFFGLSTAELDGRAGDELLVGVRGPPSEVAALDGSSGALRWRGVAGSWVTASASTSATELVVGLADPSGEARVHAWDARGARLWSADAPTGSALHVWPAESGRSPRVVLAHPLGVEVRSFDDGALIDQIGTRAAPSTDPLVLDWDSDGALELLLGCEDRTLISLQPGRGIVETVTLDSPLDAIFDGGDGDRDGYPDVLGHSRGPLLITSSQSRWRRRASDGIRATPTIADVDGDGALDIAVLGDFSGSNTLHIFDAATGVFKRRAGLSLQESIRPMTPVAAAGGVGLDLLLHKGGRLLRISGVDASIVAEVATPTSYSSPRVADIDGDGADEVITVPWSAGRVEVRRLADLRLVWSAELSDGAWASPALLRASASLDSASAVGPATIILSLHDGDLVALKAGVELWRRSLGVRQFYAPALIDIDGAGEPELLVTVAGADAGTVDLAALRGADGSQLRRWPGLGAPLGGVVLLPDEDGRGPVLVALTADEGLVAVGLTDDVERWRYRANPGGEEPGGTAPLSLVDLDRDGRAELLAAMRDGTVYALDARSGALRWSFTLGHPNVEAQPLAADIDGDGVEEVLVAGHDRELTVLRVPRRASPAPL